MQIDGNIALVTGAASGLREATARGLHANGAEVLLEGRLGVSSPRFSGGSRCARPGPARVRRSWSRPRSV
jgi:NAD(P)-dependent dehydrogenase (short-subunit alcohol dehydrogenase family)